MGPGSVLLRRGKRESPGEKRNVFSLDLNTVTESLLTTVFGSEFQTAGAEHREERIMSVQCIYRRGAHLPSLGREPLGG